MWLMHACLIFLTTALQLWIGLRLASERDDTVIDIRRGAPSVIAGAVAAALMSAMNVHEALIVAVEIAALTAGVSLCGKAGIRQSLFLAFFYEISVALWIYLTSIGLGVSLGYSSVPKQQSSAYLAASCLVVVLLPVTLRVRRRRFFSYISIAGLILAIIVSDQKILPVSDATAVTWIILAMLTVVSNVVYTVVRQRATEASLRHLSEEQNAALQREYSILQDSYASNARLFHDFHNHIHAVRRLLEDGDTEGALGYLDELQKPAIGTVRGSWTGDEAADYLLSQKAETASLYGIQTDFDIVYPHGTNILGPHLVTILGNMMDNAIEAAKDAPPDTRFIDLSIRSVNSLLVMNLANSCARAPVVEGGTLKTQKQDSSIHGWGLKSIRAAAELYDGTVETEYEGGVFRTIVMLAFSPAAQKAY